MTNVAAFDTDFRNVGDTTLDVYKAEFATRAPDSKLSASPMLQVAEDVYNAARPHSALILGHMKIENWYATAGIHIKPEHCNPLGIRPPGGMSEADVLKLPGVVGILKTGDTGNFLKFRSFADCVREWKRRIIQDPSYAGGRYAKAKTGPQYINVYAPPDDTHGVTGVSNGDMDYPGTMRAFLTRIAKAEKKADIPTNGVPPVVGEILDTLTGILEGAGNMASHKFILSAGHRNTDGGGASREIDWTYPMTKKLRDAIVRRGGQAWIVSEHDGDNDPSFSKGRGLQNAAYRCVELAKTFGTFDAYISMHYEGGPAGGFFGIFPEGGSVDTRSANANDIQLIRNIADEVVQTGMPKRTVGVVEPGVMSERQTGVGGQGFRLGEFVGTLGFQSTTCRVILEAGNYGTPADRNRIWSEQWQNAYAEAIVDGLERSFGKFKGGSNPAPNPNPNPNPAPTRQTVDFLVPMDVRRSPGFWDYDNNKSNIVAQLPAGTKGTVLEGPKTVDGMDFYNVEIPGFGTGWVAKALLNAIRVK